MREYRAGYVYKEPKREKWRGVVRYRDIDESQGDLKMSSRGTWRRTTRLFDIKCYPDSQRGKKKAQIALRAFVEELERNESRHPSAAAPQKEPPASETGPSVSEYVRYYLSEKLPGGKRIEKSTMNGYLRLAKKIDANWDGRGIGGVPIGEVRPRMVEEWRNAVAEIYKPSTVRNALRLLRAALGAAVREEIIDRNPAAGVTAPRDREKEINYLSADERSRLLADLDQSLSGTRKQANESAIYALATKMALLTGMREGEVCGLRWVDVNLVAKTIAVRGSIGRDGTKIYVKGTKSASSKRTIPITDDLLDDLLRRKALDEEIAGMCGIAWSESFYVLGNSLWSKRGSDRSCPDPKLLWRAWRRRAQRLHLAGVTGKTPCFHDLRHTFATVAAHSGISEASLKEILGHDNVTTTHRYYIGVDDEANRRAMEAVMAAMTTPQKASGREGE